MSFKKKEVIQMNLKKKKVILLKTLMDLDKKVKSKVNFDEFK